MIVTVSGFTAISQSIEVNEIEKFDSADGREVRKMKHRSVFFHPPNLAHMISSCRYIKNQGISSQDLKFKLYELG